MLWTDICRTRLPGLAAQAAALILLTTGGLAAEPQTVRDGLILEYDFSAGSLPPATAPGILRDLSGHGLHGVIRPCRQEATEALVGKGWQPHRVRQGDGRGGWLERRARLQWLKHPGGRYTMPFGLVQMDTGEIALIASWHNGKFEQPVICFSSNRGDTWSDWRKIPESSGRPMNLTCLDGGRLTFRSSRRFFSADYGRTWPDSNKLQPTSDGLPFHVEGNTWVDRDATGRAERVAALGWRYENGERWPTGAAITLIRWSDDGGRTWGDEVKPRPWVYETEYQGKTYRRGVSEGAIVRAANGWLVAAVRTDVPARFLARPGASDHFEGTAVSVSKDNGQTWSDLNWLYDAGRMHANLQRLPDGTLVMTKIVRQDIVTGSDGEYASYRRGCEALTSRDNGLTWNLDRKFVLHAFEVPDPNKAHPVVCGHIAATVLDDGSVLSAYGHYPAGAVVLVNWQPNAEILADTAETAAAATPSEVPIIEQAAVAGRDYTVVKPVNEPSRLKLDGSAWIHVPAAAALLKLADSATLEFVLEPEQQRGFITLLRCGAPAGANPRLAFGIMYDHRTGANKQAIYADERAQQTPPAYAVSVDAASVPAPTEQKRHQLAYVVDNGHGRFFRDGQPFSIQKTAGTANRTRLFRFVADRVERPEDLLITIGAAADAGLVRMGMALNATLFAVRIYDRALTTAELRTNLAAANGPTAAP